jgi:RNase P/RNase MRP subunit POP5
VGRSIVVHDQPDGTRLYLVWSSIVDAPITFGTTLDQLRDFWQEEYGRVGLEAIDDSLARGRVKTVADVVACNRAGRGETRLTAEQIVEHYFVRRGGDAPEGARLEEES